MVRHEGGGRFCRVVRKGLEGVIDYGPVVQNAFRCVLVHRDLSIEVPHLIVGVGQAERKPAPPPSSLSGASRKHSDCCVVCNSNPVTAGNPHYPPTTL